MQKQQPPDSSKPNFWGEAFTALSLGWELAVPIFGGVLIGYALDQWLSTGHIFTLGLLAFGVFAGFYSLWRFHKRFESAQNENDETEQKD